MISLFRRNIFINSILLLPYLFLIRIITFMSPGSYAQDAYDGLLTRSVYLFAETPMGQSILSAMLLFIDALLINRLVIKNHLGRENNLVSGVMYVLLVSILKQNLVLTPELLASPLVILSIQSIFNCYNNIRSADDIFLSGVYMSTASLFYPPLLIMVVFTFVALMIMRSFTRMERLQHISGWLIPYYLLFSVEYYSGLTVSWKLTSFFNGFGFFSFISNHIGVSGLLILLAILLGLVLILLNYSNYEGKKVIAAQKRINILYWFVLFCGIIAISQSHLEYGILYFVCIPASIFFTFSLMDMKNRILPEIIHLAMVLLLVTLHFHLISFS